MSAKTTHRPRRHFGKIAKMRSGRYQASYLDPTGVRRYAERTFQSRGDAAAWLARRETEVADPNWTPPQPRQTLPLVGEYVRDWIAARPLKPRTRVLYEGLLRNHIEPSPIADVPLGTLTPATAWPRRPHPRRRSRSTS